MPVFRALRVLGLCIASVALCVIAVARPAAAQLQPVPPPAPTPTAAPLQGGGLAPPPPPTAAPPTSNPDMATLRELERAEREDSGRGLQFFFFEPEVGYQWVSLDAVSSDDLFEGDADSGAGLSFGATAALRLLYFTGGARFRMALLPDYRLWSVGGELGLRIPYGSFEPYVNLGAGYLRVDAFDMEPAIQSLGTVLGDLELGGLDARLGFGVDYFVTPVFSVGALVDAELLLLWRDAVVEGSGTVFDSDGSGLGIAVTPSLVLGLHY
jgi:hypothetical protein